MTFELKVLIVYLAITLVTSCVYAYVEEYRKKKILTVRGMAASLLVGLMWPITVFVLAGGWIYCHQNYFDICIIKSKELKEKELRLQEESLLNDVRKMVE